MENREVEKPKGNRWKTVGIFIAGGLVLIFAKAIGYSAGRFSVQQGMNGYNTGQIDAALPNILSETAKKIKAQTPIKVDQNTTMIDVITAGKMIEYIYVLSFEIKSEDLEETRAQNDKELRARVCSNERTRKLIALGATMAYQYSDPSGHSFNISVASCS